MSDNNIIQAGFQFPPSPGKSSSDEQSAQDVYLPDGRHRNNEIKDNNAYAFDGGEAEKYMHTPRRNDEIPAATPTTATLSPQSQPTPPHTPPQTRKVSSITPILQRGRVLTADEMNGGGNTNDDEHFPVFVTGSPTNEYGTTPTVHNQGMLRYPSEVTASPNTTIHQNRIMTQQLQQQSQMINMTNSFSESPNMNRISTMIGGGSNHDRDDSTRVPVSMLWGSDMGGVRHPGEKPKRPLSAYNFYFQLERERIITSSEEDRDLNVTYTVDDVARLTMIQQRKAKENKPKEKRSHRKTHGKISFGDLARTIANKWKQMDKSDKEIFEGSAAIEKERYRKELSEWNKQMKKWKDAASKVASTLHYSNNGGLSNSSNHSHDITSTSYHSGNHLVTPDQIPKRTVYHNNDMVVNDESTPDHHMIHAITNQQRSMNAAGNIGSGSTNRSQLSQQIKSQRSAALQGMLEQNGQGMLPAPSNLNNRLHGLHPSLLQHSNINGISRNNGVMDYGDDLVHPYGLNEAIGDDDYYMNDSIPQNGGINLNHNYDYDDITDETYRMAQMMLPPQNSLSQRVMPGNGNVGGSPLQQQQRRLVNQRRMKMLMMMQQRYKREQMLMMQGINPFNGGANGLLDPEQYDPSLDDPQQQYIDQLDDSTSYIDPATTANHLMMNHATAAAAAAAFGRSQHHRQILQQHQKNRMVDELNASHHTAMDDQYHPMSHLLHAESFDDRA